jgi:hypothetical protein
MAGGTMITLKQVGERLGFIVERMTTKYDLSSDPSTPNYHQSAATWTN